VYGSRSSDFNYRFSSLILSDQPPVAVRSPGTSPSISWPLLGIPMAIRVSPSSFWHVMGQFSSMFFSEWRFTLRRLQPFTAQRLIFLPFCTAPPSCSPPSDCFRLTSSGSLPSMTLPPLSSRASSVNGRQLFGSCSRQLSLAYIQLHRFQDCSPLHPASPLSNPAFPSYLPPSFFPPIGDPSPDACPPSLRRDDECKPSPFSFFQLDKNGNFPCRNVCFLFHPSPPGTPV